MDLKWDHRVTVHQEQDLWRLPEVCLPLELFIHLDRPTGNAFHRMMVLLPFASTVFAILFQHNRQTTSV